jgi:hypothetical protein
MQQRAVVSLSDAIITSYNNKLVIVPYEAEEEAITPVTIHVTTRQQINFRIKTGRFTHE